MMKSARRALVMLLALDGSNASATLHTHHCLRSITQLSNTYLYLLARASLVLMKLILHSAAIHSRPLFAQREMMNLVKQVQSCLYLHEWSKSRKEANKQWIL